jgi:YD repeat-containing protein
MRTAASPSTSTISPVASRRRSSTRTASIRRRSSISNGNPVDLHIGNVRPASNAKDIKTWCAYDEAGRRVKEVDGSGAVTETVYDSASRVVSVIRYRNQVSTGGFGAAPTAASIVATPNAAEDRVTRNFYDKDGLLAATLDGEGYLVTFTYDKAGQLIERRAYNNKVVTPAGALAPTIPTPDTVNDQITRYYYDQKGRQVGEVDAENYFTATIHTLAGQVASIRRYATAVAAPVTGTLPSAPAGDSQLRSFEYDALGRLKAETGADGTRTEYRYDKAGNLISSSRDVGPALPGQPIADKRTTVARYDIFGRLVGEMSGEGASKLSFDPNAVTIDATRDAEIAAKIARYGTTYVYDAFGNRAAAVQARTWTDRANVVHTEQQRTLYFYDVDGHLTHTINALGEVEEYLYNKLGQLKSSTKYNTRLLPADLAQLNGGRQTPYLLNRLAQIANSGIDSRTTTEFDVRGLVSAVQDALGNTTTLLYNAFGEERQRDEKVDDVHNLRTTSVYDRRGLKKDTLRESITACESHDRSQHPHVGRIRRLRPRHRGRQRHARHRDGLRPPWPSGARERRL